MKGKALGSLRGRNGETVWVEFEAGCTVCCGYEEGPSTEIDDLARQFVNGRYRVEGDDLVLCSDERVRVFSYNQLISGIYEWIEENGHVD